jgi:cellulose synthase/poly-beta-1,6-N-acetylglucosamine synthase-like glycosyltransferase
MKSRDLGFGMTLIEQGVLSASALEEAWALASRWSVELDDALYATNKVRPAEFQRAVAAHLGFPFVELAGSRGDPSLVTERDIETYARLLVFPWRREGGLVVVAVAEPGPEALLFARARFGPDVTFVIAARFEIVWAIQRQFRSAQSHLAVFDLLDHAPEHSAHQVITLPQVLFAYVLLSAVLLGLALAPISTLVVLNAIVTLFYVGSLLFKALLVYYGGLQEGSATRAINAQARQLRDDELPTYTVLVPMFREPEVLPILAHALRSLDYPLAKLDVKIVLEETDHETIAAARALGLEATFEIILVPQSHPQTKPKACNYALQFARGELLVVYDAEDKPEPDQLRKVVAAFRLAKSDVVCIQCRLNYYNADENWLTRMFTLDYALWFDLMLPGLEKLRVPIPLGGTSNHLRTSVLRELRGWDPFNVTEDADLGLRINRLGYRVALVDSTTFEEANCRMGNWIRQRSRWIKGYMQTLLVHTRDPVDLARKIGLRGTLSFVVFIGGTVLASLLNPLFWGIFAIWLITSTAGFDPVFPPVLLFLSLFNLLIGNGMFMYLAMLAPFRRRWLELVPVALTSWVYWLMISVAAYKALGQLITNPFYWEKTQHGLSKQTAIEAAKARVGSVVVAPTAKEALR